MWCRAVALQPFFTGYVCPIKLVMSLDVDNIRLSGVVSNLALCQDIDILGILITFKLPIIGVVERGKIHTYKQRAFGLSSSVALQSWEI